MIVLWDMDDVLFDWSDRLRQGMLADRLLAPHVDRPRDTFDCYAGLDEDEREAMHDVLRAPFFYQFLRPLPGALEALRASEEAGHENFIVTTPWLANPHCTSEKVTSVREHLGEKWVKRLVLTHDKTIVDGDVLLDDRDRITGAGRSRWTRVWMDQPWNQVPADAVGPEALDARLLRLYGLQNSEKVATMLSWIEHVRLSGHSTPKGIDPGCSVCHEKAEKIHGA